MFPGKCVGLGDMELKPEAKDYLSIIHKADCMKVLNQIKVSQEHREKAEALSGLNEAEYSNLVHLMSKYISMLEKI